MEGEAGLGRSFSTVMFRDTGKEWRRWLSGREAGERGVPEAKGGVPLEGKHYQLRYRPHGRRAENWSFTSYHDKGRFDGGAGPEA